MYALIFYINNRFSSFQNKNNRYNIQEKVYVGKLQILENSFIWKLRCVWRFYWKLNFKTLIWNWVFWQFNRHEILQNTPDIPRLKVFSSFRGVVQYCWCCCSNANISVNVPLEKFTSLSPGYWTERLAYFKYTWNT